MSFEFATAGRILFGNGVSGETGTISAALGERALIVTGKNTERAKQVAKRLEQSGIEYGYYSVKAEPTTTDAQKGVEAARAMRAGVIIGFGGGSAIDAAKAIAALATNDGDPLDYLEVVGKGLPLEKPPLPCIAIPTTAGTGSEVTRNAVLASEEHNVKVSLRSPLMLPDAAVVDPGLTYSMPPAVTASTGLDAFTQVLEPFVSHKANHLTDALCREAIPKAARFLRRAYRDGNDRDARENMALVSLFGGLALANAKLGVVHGFAGTLGGMYPGAPHGAICARLLPVGTAVNIKALGKRDPHNPALDRYKEIAGMITGGRSSDTGSIPGRLDDLMNDLSIPPLSAYGVKRDDFAAIIEGARRSSSMKGNPIELTDEELFSILEEAV